uniref:PPR_long domain-containing protein n=1 Tax=Rhabditophanes sp. KR3021 TaxID=114890 RepID=A0AC35TGX3_9BILA
MLRSAIITSSRCASINATKISIPVAIKRSPTAILEAINSTIGEDKTAPHFSFIDDPITIPTTQQNKRMYYQSKEMGRRAAQHLAAEWPTLFMYDIDEPKIEAFRPQHPLNARPYEGTEQELVEMIKEKEVKTAVDCYEKIRSNGTELSPDVQKDLFNLVVFYNEDNIPDSEVSYHGWRNFSEEDIVNGWKSQGTADLLFETIDKTPETYSTMIAGLCKHASGPSLNKAREMFAKMLEEKMVPFSQAFDGLICVSDWKKAKEYLEIMNKCKVKPTVKTLDAVIKVLPKKLSFQCKLEHIQKIILEFRTAGVDASLATYSLILSYLRPGMGEKDENNKKIVVSILDQILANLEAMKAIPLQNSEDQGFFKIAMYVACDANSSDLVERIERIYSNPKNEVKLTAFTHEHSYYYKYLTYNLLRLPLDEAEVMYKNMVPRLVGVNRELLLVIMNRLIAKPHWSFVKRIIEDSIASRQMFHFAMSSNIRQLLMTVNIHDLNSEDQMIYRETLAKCSAIWLEISEFDQEKGKKFMTNINAKFVEETEKMFSRI